MNFRPDQQVYADPHALAGESLRTALAKKGLAPTTPLSVVHVEEPPRGTFAADFQVGHGSNRVRVALPGGDEHEVLGHALLPVAC